MVVCPRTYRTNTISQTTTTLSAINPAAKTPVAWESLRTAAMKRSATLLHAQRFVDELLAVGHFLRELRVRALARDLEPRVVLGRRERDDFDVVLLERLHHVLVEPLAFL